MKKEDVVLGLFLVLCVVSVFPLWKDPYHHRASVDFWAWLKRELYEELHGEKE